VLSSSVDSVPVNEGHISELQTDNTKKWLALSKTMTPQSFNKLKNDIKAASDNSTLNGQPGQRALAENRALAMLLELANQFKGLNLDDYINIEIGKISKENRKIAELVII
jgi:hypothetical protein